MFFIKNLFDRSLTSLYILLGDEADKKPIEDEEKYDWVFPVSVAVIAMASYAVNIGLFQATK